MLKFTAKKQRRVIINKKKLYVKYLIDGSGKMKISIQKYYEIMAPSTPKTSLISFIFPNDIAKFQRLHSPYE
ncbi:MAG: hypothetical protein AYP45_03020 [Candidatus Brocadia carolinensis]|uniref:Uncharacterized protein n=1 Tax=Candidatus Brocadia carolinensis TaxID=1004156 RepID=A0A1V4AWM2_9BACT|nr:MAG: hypothetical protein AYP45_03020 [Candidatus Brocadia caroliniensis]